MDGSGDLRGGGDATATILDRLDSIGRLLARGAPPEDAASRLAEVEAHLTTRIDMLGRIVEQLMADREEAEARAAALTGRLVDLEGSLAPALAACSARLEEAVPLLAEASIDRLPGGGAALRVILREVRDAVASLERRVASAPPPPPAPAPAATPEATPDEAPEAHAATDEPGHLPGPAEATPVLDLLAGPGTGDGEAPAASEPLLLRPADEDAGEPAEGKGDAAREDGPQGDEAPDGAPDEAPNDAPWAKGVRFRSRAFAEAVRAVCEPDGADAPASDAPAPEARLIRLDALEGLPPATPALSPALSETVVEDGALSAPREAEPPGPAPLRPAADPHADALRRLLSRSLGD